MLLFATSTYRPVQRVPLTYSFEAQELELAHYFVEI